MNKRRKNSIRTRLLGPLLILLILQAAVIAGTVLFGGVSSKLKNNEINVVNEDAEQGKRSFERQNVHYWSIILHNSDYIADEIQKVLKEENVTADDILNNDKLNQKITQQVMNKSIDFLRLSYASGAFFVLDGPAALHSPSHMKAGFYLRNSNEDGLINNNSTLLLKRGSPSLAESNCLPLDSLWKLGFLVDGQGGAADFYNKPMELAKQAGAKASEAIKYAYLSPPFRLNPKDIPVITYSVPVILSDGSVVGVCGLEISLNQMNQFLEEGQLTSNFESWVFGIRDKQTKTIVPVAHSGFLYNQFFYEASHIAYTDSEEGGISEIKSPDGTKWYGSIKSLNVYGVDNKAGEYDWVLASMAKQNDLLAFYNAIRRMLLSSMLFPLIFSLFGAFLIGKIMTEPIRALAEELKKQSGRGGLTLKRVHIREIDELTDTIEQLNRDVEQSASKISSILEHANVLIGVFEYSEGGDKVFCSRSLIDMLGWGGQGELYQYMDLETFEDYMEHTFTGIRMKGDRLFQSLESPDGTRWVEFILDESKNGTILGVCSDVTADVLEKEKLERERNFDLLTNLYNRRAFREQVEELMKQQQDTMAAAVMWDLDNLKYINDTYGHDEGDRYIAHFANCMKRFFEGQGIIARYSGDEFVTYLRGGGKERIRMRIREFMKYIQSTTVDMAGGYQFPVRVSGGLSWYPDNGKDFETLFNYADFAMYMVKHSVKGAVKEFDPEEYYHNSYMLTGSEELNRMLDTKKVRFVFQPIVTRDGSIYGYELLMRPQFTNMKGVSEVLNLARAQAKLPQMETLTWFAGLHSVFKELGKGHLGKDEKIFINSIASVCITEEEQEELENSYKDLLSRIVIEMTEGEPANHDYMERKIKMAKDWNGMIAVDDFGTGYNSESVLLNIQPEIVKVDMSLVKRINEDAKRQIILKNLLGFAKENDIMVLAEGVETAEELEYLMQCGVSLFQGYYIARPQMEIRPLDPYIIGKMQEFSGKT